jgi:hypothetical protein
VTASFILTYLLHHPESASSRHPLDPEEAASAIGAAASEGEAALMPTLVLRRANVSRKGGPWQHDALKLLFLAGIGARIAAGYQQLKAALATCPS